MEKQNTNINVLLKQVEAVFGKKPQGPSDFDSLAMSIFDVTHQNVAVSTLKRLWGYVHSDTNPRPSTLDVLSLYVGYTGWEAFCYTVDNSGGVVESNLLIGGHLAGDDVQEGRLIRVLWQPDRMCVFRSLGNARFVVIESHNSKLSVGDSFTCHTFINNEPLYLTDLITKTAVCPVSYVCGKDNGVTVIK